MNVVWMLLSHYYQLFQFLSVGQKLISEMEAYKVLWKGVRKPLCYPELFLSDGKKRILKRISFPLTNFFPLPLKTLVTASLTGLFSWDRVVERGHPGNSPLEFPHSSPFPFCSLPSSISRPVVEYSTSGLHGNNSVIWISFWWKKFFPDDCRSFQILFEHNLQCPAVNTSLNHYEAYPHLMLSVEGQVSLHFRSHKTSKMFR